MNLRALLSIPLSLSSLTSRLPFISTRHATTMTLDSSKLNVFNQPLQPLTNSSHTTHPTGYQRDGYCWGIKEDPGSHYIGAVVTQEFLEFSKARGNDLMTRRPNFPGLKDGCRWCLCVERWKEALTASERLGAKVVPRVDLNATALPALQRVEMKDLERFKWTESGSGH